MWFPNQHLTVRSQLRRVRQVGGDTVHELGHHTRYVIVGLTDVTRRDARRQRTERVVRRNQTETWLTRPDGRRRKVGRWSHREVGSGSPWKVVGRPRGAGRVGGRGRWRSTWASTVHWINIIHFVTIIVGTCITFLAVILVGGPFSKYPWSQCDRHSERHNEWYWDCMVISSNN